MSVVYTIADIIERVRQHAQHIGGEVFAVADDSRLVFVDHRGPCRVHELTGTPSLLAFAERHGTAAESAVYVDATGVRLVLEERGGADHSAVTMSLADSTAVEAWRKVIGREMTPVQLRTFFEDRQDDLQSRGTLAAVSAFKARVEVEFEADLETDASTVFRVKEGAKGTKADIPKDFGINVPLWLGHAKKYTLSIGLDVTISKDGPPTFRLRFRDLPDVRDVALCDLHAEIASALPGWLVVRGVPKAHPAVVAKLLNGTK